MRIGVVSDTHNHLPNVARIVEILNRAGLDRVVHTGDITRAKTLEVLAQLDAPRSAWSNSRASPVSGSSSEQGRQGSFSKEFWAQ